MVEIVFPTSSSPGLYPQESAGRLINAFVEKTIDGAPGATLWRRSAGLYYLTTAVSGHTRGFLDYVSVDVPDEGVLTRAVWALDNQLVQVVRGQTATEFTIILLGPLPGTEPVTMARNNTSPKYQAVAVTNEQCWIISTIAEGLISPIPYEDEDLPPNPTSVCSADGYFVWSFTDGRIFASDLNNLEVSALSFNTEQGQSVLRVVFFSGRLYAFGNKWTGVYRDAGTVPFPFLREASVPRGILNPHAVAGWEPGWANELIWVGDDCIVYKLNGYVPVPISTDPVTRSIQRMVLLGDKRHIEAFVYMYGKNAFWVISGVSERAPEANFTWEYNSTTGQWNERQSYPGGVPMTNWRGHRSLRANDGWLIGDLINGNLYAIVEEYFAEAAGGEAGAAPDPLVWTVESGVMSGFPARMVIPRASFNMTAGVGWSGFEPGRPNPEPDPKVFISWSLDGGATWGIPLVRSLGKDLPSGLAETRFYPSVMCSGLSRGQGVRYRLVVEDAVHVGLSGGDIEVQPRTP